MRRFTLLAIIFILLPIAYANRYGHLKLLAVKETPFGYNGSIADLYLEIRPGTGKVFLETFPLTKLDTQFSTRFAKEIACDFIGDNCNKYDFIYTIKAPSIIIGGPSAGAAISALTVALLKDLNLNEDIAITGTINSGGIIGQVGRIKEKIEAAASVGLKKVLIPQGERFYKHSTIIFHNLSSISINKTKDLDLVDYGKKLGIEVIEISNLNEAIYHLTGIKLRTTTINISIDKSYKETMKLLAIRLCDRSNTFKNKVDFNAIKDENLTDILELALNLTNESKIAFGNQQYYSAASYCFGANVRFSFLLLYSQNLSKEEIADKIEIIKNNARKIEDKINIKKKITITDLEAYAAVKERIIEALDYLKKIENLNSTKHILYNLAYASERVYSAYSWYEFFDHRGKKFNLNKLALKNSCEEKVGEAEERYQYITLLFPLTLMNTKSDLYHVYDDLKNGRYELCLFKASKIKAKTNAVISTLGLEKNEVQDLIKRKIKIVKQNIARETEKNIFPILAYSYFEYGDFLKEKDIYSALLYLEYALELSNLELYFGEKKFYFNPNPKIVFTFFVGFILGFIVSKLIKK